MLLCEKERLLDAFGTFISNNAGGNVVTMAELLERARAVAAECGAANDHPLLQLVEDVCREGERLAEEARKEQKDLLQQVIFFCIAGVFVLLNFD